MIFGGFGGLGIRSKNNFLEKVDFSGFRFFDLDSTFFFSAGQKLKTQKIDLFNKKKIFVLHIASPQKPPKIMLGVPGNFFKRSIIDF